MSRRARALLLCLLALAAAGPAHAAAPRIVGGEVAAPGTWGFIAILTFQGESSPDGQFCAGSLIAPDLVLTASHCLQGLRPSGVDVVTGSSRLSVEAPGTRSRVVAWQRDPKWHLIEGHDLALVRLQDPSAVAPVALAGAGDTRLTAAGRHVLIAGWGLVSQDPAFYPDRLHDAGLTVLPGDRCRRVYGDFSATEVCASSKGTDGCEGDSGGPMVSLAGGAPVLVGVTSYGGRRCGDARFPGVYTRVSGEAAWLKSALAELSGSR